MIGSAQTIVGRQGLCRLPAAVRYNIILGNVDLAGTTRTFDEDTRRRIIVDLTHVAESVASALLDGKRAAA